MTKNVRLHLLYLLLYNVLAIFVSIKAHASVYIGGGGAFSRTSYKASGSKTITPSSNLKKEYSMLLQAASSRFTFKGTRSELQDLIYSTFPINQGDMEFFLPLNGSSSVGASITLGKACVANSTIKQPSLYPISGTGCTQSNPNSPPAALVDLSMQSDDTILPLIEYDLGRAMGGFFISQMKSSLTLHFSTIEGQDAFFKSLGQKFLVSLTGKSDYTAQDALNAIGSSPMFSSGQSFLQLGILSGEEMLYQFQIFQEALENALLDTSIINLAFSGSTEATGAQAVELLMLNDSASGSALELFLVAGIGKEMAKVYMGGEFVLDAGKVKAGKNSNMEINLSSFYTISLLYKAGYSFSPNSFSYLNLGVAMRDYKVKYEGTNISFKDSGLAAHLVVGTGIEFHRSHKTSIFTELNYMIAASPVKTGSPDRRTLNVASAQIKAGFKYYLDHPPFMAKASSSHHKPKIYKREEIIIEAPRQSKEKILIKEKFF